MLECATIIESDAPPMAHTVDDTEVERVPEPLLGAVCATYGVSRGDVLGRSRRSAHVEPRHVLMWVLVDDMGWSHSAVGRALNRDHSTVIKGVQRMRSSSARVASRRDATFEAWKDVQP
jgi:chromosomal replication initiation ATPase DnaA